MTKRVLTSLLTAAGLASVLAACGGGGSDGTAENPAVNPTIVTLGGGGVKGPLGNATVTAFELDLSAADLKGPVLDTATTNRTTAAIEGLEVPEGSAPFLLEFTTNATTVDITTGQAPIIRTLRTLVTPAQVTANEQLYATPLTTAAVRIAIRMADTGAPFGGNNDGTITQGELLAALPVAAQRVKSTLGFGLLDNTVDIFRDPPMLNANTTDSASIQQVARLRKAIEGVAALTVRLQQEPGLGAMEEDDLLDSIADDLALDGVLDGDGDIPVAAFNALAALNGEGLDIDQLEVPNTSGQDGTDGDALGLNEIDRLIRQEFDNIKGDLGFADADFDLDGGLADLATVLRPGRFQTTADLDGDGILNSEDDDIDGDGIRNVDEQPQFRFDTDNDGINNAADDDDDNDGISDADDADDFDTDNDGIRNDVDDDIDGDGVANDQDDADFDRNVGSDDFRRPNNQPASAQVTLASGLSVDYLTRNTGDKLDMMSFFPASNPTHLIACIEGSREADINGVAGKFNPSVQRIALNDGTVETILRGMARCDGIRTTAWGTILATEETTDGAAYEIIDPLNTTEVTISDRGTAGTDASFTGSNAANIVKRTALPTMAWEGLTVLPNGVIIAGDELRPGTTGPDTDGGAIFKFVPSAPRAASGNISTLSESPLVGGNTFALRADCREESSSSFPQFGQGCEIGNASWVSVNAATARNDADTNGATGYYRPEDLHIDPTFSDANNSNAVRFCWANTGNRGADNFGEVICGVDSAPLTASATRATVIINRFVEGDAEFNAHDNLAFQPGSGNLYVIEDNSNGDIWSCLPDGADRDIKSDGCLRIMSVVDTTAEPTGFIFSPDGNTAYVSIQHTADGNMPLFDDFRTDDLLVITGFQNITAGENLTFGQERDAALLNDVQNQFGFGAPLAASSSSNITRRDTFAVDGSDLPSAAIGFGDAAGEQMLLAGGLSATYQSRRAGHHLDMYDFFPADNPTHLVACIETSREADINGVAGKFNPSVQRISLADGSVETMIRGMARCDGIRTTPWGTVLATEETGDGAAYEIIDPLNTTEVTVSDRGEAGTAATFSGANAANIVKRTALPTMAWEGLTVLASGVVIAGDELRPGTGTADADGGAIFKFVPSTPRTATENITDLDQSPLIAGDSYAMQVSCRDNRAQFGQGCEIGNAVWISVNAATARGDANTNGATGYYRPEDLHQDPTFSGEGVRFCWANTGRKAASNFGEVICGIDSAPLVAADDQLTVSVNRFIEGDAQFNSLDNLAFQPGTGILYVIEDDRNGDVWACLPDGDDQDIKSDGCVRVLSLTDQSAEPTGFAFSADGRTAFVSVQHSADSDDLLFDDFATDDLVKITGFGNVVAQTRSFGEGVDNRLAANSARLFGYSAPLNASAAQDFDGDGVPDAQDPFPLDPNRSRDTDNDGIDDSIDRDDDGDGVLDVDDIAPLDPLVGTNDFRRQNQLATDQVELASGLSVSYLTRRTANNLDMYDFFPASNPTHLVACIETSREADINGNTGKFNPSVQRIRLSDGQVETMVRGMARCDGIRTTPWGTILATEETGDGAAYEIIDPLNTTEVTISDRGTPGTAASFTGSDAANIIKRVNLPTMAWEGLTVLSSGVVIAGDELRPGTGSDDADGGAIFKFVPATPRTSSDNITDLSQSPLVDGASFALQASCRDSRAQFGQGCEIGNAAWISINAATARGDADTNGATGFYRPEDLHRDPTFSDSNNADAIRFCWANTGNRGASNFGEVICGVDSAPLTAAADQRSVIINRFVEGDVEFNALDNLAFQPNTGNLYVIEDNSNGDIWACLPDGADQDIKSDGCVRVLSVNDTTAEPTGFAFSADGSTAYLSIQHSADGNMPLIDDFRTDDLLVITGFQNITAGANLTLGTRRDQALVEDVNDLFGFGTPLAASSTASENRIDTFAIDGSDLPSVATSFGETVSDHLDLAAGLSATYQTRRAGHHLDMYDFFPISNPTHLIACIETSREADINGVAGKFNPSVQRISLADGSVETMVRGMARCDGIRTTPWGTIVATEETGDGAAYEIINPLNTTEVTISDRGTAGTAATFTGNDAANIVKRTDMPTMAWEGLTVLESGVVIAGDELRPGTATDDADGGAIFKFIPTTPRTGSELITDLSQSPLIAGSSFALQVSCRDSRAQFGQGCEIGNAAWISINAATARSDANTNGATGYYRPEDLHRDPTFSDPDNADAVRFCWANTGNRGASNFGEVICGVDAAPLTADADSRTVVVNRFIEGDDQFNALDNLAFQPGTGILYVIEDNSNGDVWACLPDGDDRDIKSDGCVRVLSLRDQSAEPTGFAFDATGTVAFVSIQHSSDSVPDGDNRDLSFDDFRTDDLLRISGFQIPATPAVSFGEEAERELLNSSAALFGIGAPLNMSAEKDFDGDGVPDDEDAFPTVPGESFDSDGDGIGDNTDTDDDNDGTPDAQDAFPNDANRQAFVTGSFQLNQSLGSVRFEGGNTLDLSVGFGSGAFRDSNDPANVFWTLTDRGPNVACDDSLEIIGINGFCVDNGSVDEDGKIFPQPDFNPTLYQVRIDLDANGNYQPTILKTLPLRNRAGVPVTGLTNPLSPATDTENSFGPDGAKLTFDPEGLDTEAVVRLQDGSFWLAEEYGPSLIHVDEDGEILERLVPTSVAAQLSEANYSVTGVLPDILKKRKLNRGIESLGIDPDENFLYFAMQSPLANPDNDAYKASRNVRIFKLALNADGSFNGVVGEFVYVLDQPATFGVVSDNTGDINKKQNNVKVSELLALAEDDLIILERVTKTTKLYRVNLRTAENIFGSEFDNISTSPTLEQTFDLAGVGATPVIKQLVFNTLTDMPAGITAPSKLEGLVILDSNNIMLINDNDFGIAGADTQVLVLPSAQALTNGDAPNSIAISELGRFETGQFDVSAAEIVDHHPGTQQLFIVNAQNRTVDVVDIRNPAQPRRVRSIDVTQAAANLGAANSVAVGGNTLAVAVENADKQANGVVAFYDISNNLNLLGTVTVGALPDMVTFTPDGSKVLVANEGEPNDAYDNDPEGSVSIIDVSNGVASASVTSIGFSDFNVGGSRAAELPAGVRVFGPNASVAQDLEPEYIAVSADSATAYVILQENNGLVEIDLAQSSITKISALGFKDHSIAGNALDPSNRDDGINIANHPVMGIYMPDAIAAYTVNNEDLIVTANEGDSRDYDGFSEEVRIKDLTLDPTVFPNAAELQANEVLGRLKTTTTLGDIDNDNDVDQLFAFGARSFSIFSADRGLLFDSGEDFARITAGLLPNDFNANGTGDSFDSRSDDKGAEPEGVAIGTIDGRTYAFVGLERVGGIMVYDITSPFGAQFIQYLNTSKFIDDPVDGAANGDISPEGLKFISAANSPVNMPLLVVGHEVSGTTAIYRIDVRDSFESDIDRDGSPDLVDEFPQDRTENRDIDGDGTGDVADADDDNDGRNDNVDAFPFDDTLQADSDGDGVADKLDAFPNDAAQSGFVLQLLHAADQEGGADAVQDAPRFSAVLNALRDQFPNNTVTLSSGDNYIPGPFFSASDDDTVAGLLGGAGVGRGDILILNAMGFEASAIGNHEFDVGPSGFAALVRPDLSNGFDGARFPYLSSNVDVSADSNLGPLVVTDAQEAETIPNSIAKSTIVTVNGQRIGVVGATTPTLATISSTGSDVVISPADSADTAALAAVIQQSVDALTQAGVNKVIVLAHMQQIAIEKALAPLLTGVDVIVAGGSNTLLADSNDRLRAGDTVDDTYPLSFTAADSNPVLVVNTDGNYKYVGRLVMGFDDNGVLQTARLDDQVNGAYATDEAGVTAVGGTADVDVATIASALGQVLVNRESNQFGVTTVYLNGVRGSVRTEETNLGNLTADANLFVAQQFDNTVAISIKNGGGIRDDIGEVIVPPGATGDDDTQRLPPQAIPSANKETGEISQFDIQNTLRFNNELTLLTVTAADLKALMEHAVSSTADGATPGRFPQIAGFRFSFDATRTARSTDADGAVVNAGERIRSLAVVDANGAVVDTVVQDGTLQGDANRTFRVVTLNFLAGGGDGYPFPSGDSANSINLTEQNLDAGTATFADAGSEQDALAEFLAATFPAATPFSQADVPPAEDTRIQNLSARSDTVLSGN